MGMNDKEINQLPALSEPQSTDVIPVSRGDSFTKKLTIQQLLDFVAVGGKVISSIEITNANDIVIHYSDATTLNAGSITKLHTQDTDTKLAEGTINKVTALEIRTHLDTPPSLANNTQSDLTANRIVISDSASKITSSDNLTYEETLLSNLLKVQASLAAYILIKSLSTEARLIIDTAGDGSVGRITFQKNGVSTGGLAYYHNAIGALESIGINLAGGSDEITILGSGRMGIGTNAPDAKLDVRGTVKIVDGSQGAGRVLTSDTNGLATWGNAPIPTSEKGAANGVATLEGTGKIPASQLPSYVDDVLEFADLASFPVTGETGKIYIAIDSEKTYRWTGSIYVEVGSSGVGGAGISNRMARWTTSNTLGNSDYIRETSGTVFIEPSDSLSINYGTIGYGAMLIKPYQPGHAYHEIYAGSGEDIRINIGSGGARFVVTKLNYNSVPTSPVGLISGDIWNDSGTLKIV